MSYLLNSISLYYNSWEYDFYIVVYIMLYIIIFYLFHWTVMYSIVYNNFL